MSQHNGRKCRRVQEVDENEDLPDEPQQLHWFSAPIPASVTEPSENRPVQIHPGIYGMQGFLNGQQQYPGDLTAEEAIENTQNLPPPTYGKVSKGT